MGSKNVYYVVKLTSGSGSRISGRLSSVEDALQFIYRRGATLVREIGAGALQDRHQIVRVEETISAPRRELVTTGDLSLLDKGPVVIKNIFEPSFAGPDGQNVYPSRLGSVGDALNAARVFKNAASANAHLMDKSVKAYGTVVILPIREIPGETIVTETVLA